MNLGVPLFFFFFYIFLVPRIIRIYVAMYAAKTRLESATRKAFLRGPRLVYLNGILPLIEFIFVEKLSHALSATTNSRLRSDVIGEISVADSIVFNRRISFSFSLSHVRCCDIFGVAIIRWAARPSKKKKDVIDIRPSANAIAAVGLPCPADKKKKKNRKKTFPNVHFSTHSHNTQSRFSRDKNCNSLFIVALDDIITLLTQF